MRTIEQPIAGGVDFFADPINDPDDTTRWRVVGDAFPRVEISPRGSIAVGNGTVAPTIIGSSTGGATIGGARPVYNVLDAGLIRVGDPGYVLANTKNVNTLLFQFLVNNHVGEGCDFLFPPGVYDTAGFTVSDTGQRIVGAGGAASAGAGTVGTRFDFRGAAGTPCVQIKGSIAVGGRKIGLGMVGVEIKNPGGGLYGLTMEHLSHFQLDDVWVSGFRGDGGGIRFANAMDGALYDCCVDFCGSAVGTDLAAVKFTATDYLGAACEDACNEIRFFRFRLENTSDRGFDFDSVGGLLVNKIEFFGCKFENSQQDTNGTNGSNTDAQAYFRFDHADYVTFHGCDFTFQALSTLAFGTLRRMMLLINGSRVELVGCRMFSGALGAIQVFDTWIEAKGNTNNHLMLCGLLYNSSNPGSFPTVVLRGDAVTKPCLNQHGVGFDQFQGSGKVAADWFTAGEWSTLGQVA